MGWSIIKTLYFGHFMDHLIVTQNWETFTLSILITWCNSGFNLKINSTRNRWVMMMETRIRQNLQLKEQTRAWVIFGGSENIWCLAIFYKFHYFRQNHSAIA